MVLKLADYSQNWDRQSLETIVLQNCICMFTSDMCEQIAADPSLAEVLWLEGSGLNLAPSLIIMHGLHVYFGVSGLISSTIK